MNTRSAALLLAFLPAALSAQTGSIAGVIVSAGTRDPLAYGIVSLSGTGLTVFTSDSGRFGFRDIPAGRRVIHVRRLGFTPREVIIEIRAGITDSLTIELDHVAVSMGRITVRSWPPCTAPGAPMDSALAPIVQQIRLNAEQFRFLSAEYPFTYDILITRSMRLRRNGLVVSSPAEGARYSSKAKRSYTPGEVISRRGRAYFFEIPTLSEVADPKFIARHCWHYGGIESIDEEEMYRVDIVADDSLKGPDVNGSFFVNKFTFQIRRSILYLSKRHPSFRELLGLETTTDFFEVLTSISIPSHTHSVQSTDPAQNAEFSEAFEEHRTLAFKFVGRRPGEAVRKK